MITSPSDVECGPRSPGLSITNSSSSFLAAPKSPSPRHSTTSKTAQPTKSKKKPSFLGTLFTKEPSTDAFLQMQDQTRKQIAQSPGQRSFPSISGVSSVKIPEHVPKVNSKWDGMPRRSKEDSDKKYSRSDSQISSPRTSSARSRSANPERSKRRPRPHSGCTTSSSHASDGISAKTSHRHQKHVESGEGEPVSGNVPSRHRANAPRSKSISIRPQPLRSPSGSSLPQITSFFPNDIPEPPRVPRMYGMYGINGDSERSAQSSTEILDKKDMPKAGELVFEALTIHVRSPSLTPQVQSPMAPLSVHISMQPFGGSVAKVDDSSSFPLPDRKMRESIVQPPGSDVLGRPTVRRRASKDSVQAFLAGEARSLRLSEDDQRPRTSQSVSRKDNKWHLFGPGVRVRQDLEARPDSSRSRLGLKASIIKSDDIAPWERDQGKDSRSNKADRAASSHILRSKSIKIFDRA